MGASRKAKVALAVALMVVAVALMVVVGNYTVAKNEVKHQYKEHGEESVDKTKQGAKSWIAWAMDRIKEGFGYKAHDLPLESTHVHRVEDDDDDERQRPGKAEKIENMAAEKVSEMKEAAEDGALKQEL